jgi:pilus assembly protein Flp/PilA
MTMKKLHEFLKCQSGATAIEYGLIAGLIGVVIITAVGKVGNNISTKFTKIGNALN